LVVGETYDNLDEQFSVQVTAQIDGGLTTQVTMAPDTRPVVPDVVQWKSNQAGAKVQQAGFVPVFTGASPTQLTIVDTQQPKGGERANAGSTVTMHLKKLIVQ
jgi:beta-lactam-binding protein with PASTA domain